MRLPVLVVLSFVGPAAAADPPSVEELFPLSVGRSWTYKVTGGGPGPTQQERFVVRVKAEEMVGDATCFRLEASLGDRVVATECVGFSGDSVFRFKVEKEEVYPPVPFLKPLKAAGPTGWDLPAYRIGTRTASAKFTAYPPAELKGTKYRAVRVVGESKEAGEGARKTTVWYAPGVGIVRQQVDGLPGRGPIVLELESFEKGEGLK